MDVQLSNSMKRILLVLSSILLSIGNCGGPLIMRLYFVRGGSRTWLSTWLLTGGWPLTLIPLAVSYSYRRKSQGSNAKVIIMKLPVFISSAMIGVLLGGVNYLSAYGVARLPVSTAALILSSAIVFTALSAYVIVKQKFTAYSINAVVLLTVGAAVLGLHAGGDRPAGESSKTYILGFVLLIASAAGSGIMMPLIELAYTKAKQATTYSLVMEFQVVMCLSATIVATVGMIVNNDFRAIPREAREFQLGEVKYYVVLVFNAILWQLYNWGFVGVIFSSSALVSGIFIGALLPITQVLAVIFFHDKFSGEKGIALVLCVWGFVSYNYGEFKASKRNQIQDSETNPTPASVDP